VGRRESQKKYGLSANLIQLWLTQYDRGELNREEVEAWAAAEYEAKIAALVELIGQIQDEFAFHGYRRVTRELRKRGHVVNHKRVARVMRERGGEVLDLL